MNKTIALVAGMCLIASASFADFLQEDRLGWRFDAVVDFDSSDDPTWGGEIGFGSAILPLDDVGIFGGYRENDDMTFKSAGGYIEEHMRTGTPLYPYLGVGLAYGWHEPDGPGEDESGAFGRLQGGVKFALSDWVAINAGVIWSISLEEELFLDSDGELDDDNVEFFAGLRFYY